MAKINITYPISGDTLKLGGVYIIRWVPISPTSTSVEISLYDNLGTTLVQSIASPVENSGLYIWEVPESLPVGSYTVRVKEIGFAVLDTGSAFTVESSFSFDDFSNLNTLNRNIIIEWELGIEIEDVWTLYGSAQPYYVDFSEGEAIRVQHNGVDLTRCYSINYCEETINTYYHDIVNNKLYVNINEDPNGSGVFIMAYFIHGATDENTPGNPIDFTPEGCIQSIHYAPVLDVSSVQPITQRVAEYYTGAVVIQFGGIKLLNNGFYWEKRKIYQWHNKILKVKVGEYGAEYDEYIKIYTGISRDPDWSDKILSVTLNDKRAGELKKIPISRFSSTEDPALSENAENKVKPILFGQKTGCVATKIDETSTGYVYKLSETTFNSVYPLNSLSAVYQAGVRVYENINYNKDLTNGEITFYEDPKDDLITFDAQGLCCQFDFTGATSGLNPGDPTGVYSENVADILFFILTELNDIPVARIDLTAFADLQTKRTSRLGCFLNSSINTINVIRELQMSAVFHLIPTLSGGYTVRYYDRGTPTDSKHYYDKDYKSFNIKEKTDGAFNQVVIQYDKDPEKDTWKEVYYTSPDNEYQYNSKTTLPVQSWLLVESEATALSEFFGALVEEPPEKLSVTIPPGAFENIPSDKAFFTRSIIDDRGVTQNIFTEEVYLILEVRKDLSKGTTKLVALLDTQAGGTGSHSDVAHIDDHSDESHSDYTDTAHTDTAYIDSYTDTPHSDEAHVNNHTDLYTDDYTDYTDTPAHLDLHADHYGDYTDVTPYSDSPYADSHLDVAHGDGHSDEHTNTHTDEYSDVPHSDSEV